MKKIAFLFLLAASFSSRADVVVKGTASYEGTLFGTIRIRCSSSDKDCVRINMGITETNTAFVYMPGGAVDEYPVADYSVTEREDSDGVLYNEVVLTMP